MKKQELEQLVENVIRKVLHEAKFEDVKSKLNPKDKITLIYNLYKDWSTKVGSRFYGTSGTATGVKKYPQKLQNVEIVEIRDKAILLSYNGSKLWIPISRANINYDKMEIEINGFSYMNQDQINKFQHRIK